MTEQEADLIMRIIELYTLSPDYENNGDKVMLLHLYELGKLRDDKLDANIISYMYRSKPPLFSYGMTDEGKLWEEALGRLHAM